MDVQTLARTARENLARGLAALQSPGLPAQVGQTAEPIAAAMSSLLQVEKTNGVGAVESAHAALAYVRHALAQLQTAGVVHAAIDQAMEAIAGSLSSVHQLSVQVANASVVPSPPTQQSPAWPAPAPAPAPAAAAVSPTAATQLAPQPVHPAPAYQAPAPAYPAAAPAYPAPAYQAPAPAYPAPAYQAPAPAPAQQAPAPAYQAPPAAQQAPAPVQHAPAAQAPQHAPPPAAGAPAPHRPAYDAIRVEAALGAHSATNFYKGLSGNDVIDSGGIFIATYSIPRVGQELVIRVSMPGGYEFEALGIVRWTRDSPNSGGDGQPGFGAQFTSIAPEARQLVYRYVRNREPLFHDDL